MLIRKIFLAINTIIIFSGSISPAQTTVIKIKSCNKILNENESNSVEAILTKRLVFNGIKNDAFEINRSGDILSISFNKEVARDFKNLLTKRGYFEVREVYTYGEFKDVLFNINNSLKDDPDKTIMQMTDSSEDTAKQIFISKNPLFAFLVPVDFNVQVFEPKIKEGAGIGFAFSKDTAVVNKILKSESVKKLIPADVDFSWSSKHKNENVDSTDSNGLFELYALKKADENSLLNSTNIEKASVEKSRYNRRPEVIFKFKPMAILNWGQLTEKNIGRPLALVIDGETYSVPIVQAKIESGYCAISGGLDDDEAKICGALMSCGVLPDKMCIVEQ